MSPVSASGDQGQGDQRDAVTRGDGLGEAFARLRETKNMLRVSFGQNEQFHMRCHRGKHRFCFFWCS